MNFLKQIKFEIKNILRSKFLLIIAILIVAAGAAIPVLNYFSQKNRQSYEPYPIDYYGVAYEQSGGRDIYIDKYYADPEKEGQQSLTIGDITIYSSNPFFWNIQSLLNEKEYLNIEKNIFSSSAALDLMLELIEDETQFYLGFARYIVTYQDYRYNLAWQGLETLYDRFFFEHNDADPEALIEVASYRRGVDPQTFKNTYILITAAQKLAGLDKADEYLGMLETIVANNDFAKFIDYSIKQQEDQIEDLKANIAIQLQAIHDNPSQEPSLSAYIDELERQIENIETNTIPLLEYRLAKNIIPGLNIWQNNAINDIESSRSQLTYLVIMSEEEFNSGERPNDEYYYNHEYYGPQGSDGSQTYAEYVASMQKQIDAYNKKIIIAQKSLDSDKPDMTYVPDGPRSRTVNFLQYSTFVAIFGVLLGGWLIASEFQQGTIRLLMIRPKTRTKILLSKFLAAIVVCFAVYFCGSLLNLIANGILFGFQDFAFPNYTVAGQIGFLAYYLPKFLVCLLPILFAFVIAFMLSVVLKNSAVAIVLPILLLISSLIIMTIFSYQEAMKWIVYTPLPFMQMASFFTRYSTFQNMINNGINLSITYGALLLLGLSALITAISVYVFKKRDIVN
ncbi:MAG TPA: hypothetical protein DD640_00170 [Clostridiales bacterium]|nr:hypothetical protein [Clostridiales bacterium]